MKKEIDPQNFPTITLQMTGAIVDDPSPALDGPGAYVLFWADPMVHRPGPPGTGIVEVELVPICAAQTEGSLRSDVATHILGNSETSLRRAALGLMLRERLDLALVAAATATGFRIEPEDRLTEWNTANTVIGYAGAKGTEAADILKAFEDGKMDFSGFSHSEIARQISDMNQPKQ